MDLKDRFLALKDFGFEFEATPYERDSALDAIEGMAHEVAHALAARMSLPRKSVSRGFMSENIGAHHRKMSPRGSDEQELRTIAIEIEALSLAGIAISPRRVVDFAIDNMKSDFYMRKASCLRLIEMYRKRPSVARDARRLVRYVCSVSAT